MLKIRVHNKFKKDLKQISKRGYNEEKLWSVVEQLANGIALPPKNRDHALTGKC